MKILYTLPAISIPHGGYLIVCEHITRLQKLGHDVALFIENSNTKIAWERYKFPVTINRKAYKDYDCIVIGSPHSIWMQDYIKPHQKCFLFMQMVEEKFRPFDALWHRQCKQFYLSKFPIIHGSKWGESHCRKLGRSSEMHYIGNGVNLDHFPISNRPKEGKTVLIEGWEASNPAKDNDHIGPRVAQILRANGYIIKAYGFQQLATLPNVPHEYHHRPSLAQMNKLYEEATILLKVTRYDARALSPMEAMSKGTVTARAITQGDDDLIDSYNCLRSIYDGNQLLNNALWLLNDSGLRERLATNCLEYVKANSWDKIIDQLNQILES